MLNNLISLYSGAGAAATSYESIATVTVGAGGSSSITFSSIPSTYSHLQIRAIAKNTENSTASQYYTMTFNGDTAANYSWHALYGSGSTAASQAGTSASSIIWFDAPRSTASYANMFGAFVFDILDYTNTNKYTTTRAFSGFDVNGSGYIGLYSGSWRNTNAITSITIGQGGFNLAQYSSFALYGVKG